MTKLQWSMVQDLSRCKMAPATFEKRFARDMIARGKKYKLSEKQAGNLWIIHYRYRKQIHERVLRHDVSERNVNA